MHLFLVCSTNVKWNSDTRTNMIKTNDYIYDFNRNFDILFSYYYVNLFLCCAFFYYNKRILLISKPLVVMMIFARVILIETVMFYAWLCILRWLKCRGQEKKKTRIDFFCHFYLKIGVDVKVQLVLRPIIFFYQWISIKPPINRRHWLLFVDCRKYDDFILPYNQFERWRRRRRKKNTLFMSANIWMAVPEVQFETEEKEIFIICFTNEKKGTQTTWTWTEIRI